MKFKAFLLLIMVCFYFTAYAGYGQSNLKSKCALKIEAPSDEKEITIKDTEKKLMLFRGTYSIVVPKSYQGFVTVFDVDYWHGYISSQEDELKINISAPFVLLAFWKNKESLLWTKVEKISAGELKLGLKKLGETHEAVANIGGLEVTAFVKCKEDFDVFLRVVRSIKVEECDKCEKFTLPSRSHLTNHCTRGGNKDFYQT